MLIRPYKIKLVLYIILASCCTYLTSSVQISTFFLPLKRKIYQTSETKAWYSGKVFFIQSQRSQTENGQYLTWYVVDGFLETGSLYVALADLKLALRLGWSWTCRDLPASAFWVLELGVCITNTDNMGSFKETWMYQQVIPIFPKMKIKSWIAVWW